MLLLKRLKLLGNSKVMVMVVVVVMVVVLKAEEDALKKAMVNKVVVNKQVNKQEEMLWTLSLIEKDFFQQKEDLLTPLLD